MILGASFLSFISIVIQSWKQMMIEQCLFGCLYLPHSSICLIECSHGVSIVLPHFIVINFFPLCLPHFHFSSSFCFCLSLSLAILLSRLTSDTYFRESTKSEMHKYFSHTVISDSYNHCLSASTAHFQNYKAQKQRSNAADFVDTKTGHNTPLLLIRVYVTKSSLLYAYSIHN